MQDMTLLGEIVSALGQLVPLVREYATQHPGGITDKVCTFASALLTCAILLCRETQLHCV